MGIIFRALSSVAHQFISFVFKSDVLLCFTTTYLMTKHQTWKGTGHLDRPLHGCDDDYRESGALSWSNTSEWISNKQCTYHISTANAYARRTPLLLPVFLLAIRSRRGNCCKYLTHLQAPLAALLLRELYPEGFHHLQIEIGGKIYFAVFRTDL